MAQRLAQHLVSKGLLPAPVVDEALKKLAREGGTLDTVLLEMKAVSEAGILQAISDVSGVRLVNLSDFEPNAEAGPLMPFKMARQLNVVPLSIDGASLHLACTYPLHAPAQFKEVGQLLGRSIEVWVALECRVRDWQQVLYGQKVDVRIERLLSQLDPLRRKKAEAVSPGDLTETFSAEVMDRIARGIIEEPILLDRPKRKRAAVEPLEDSLSVDEEGPQTSMLDPTAYSRFARAEDGSPPEDLPPSAPALADQHTRVMDISGYENFAKGISAPVEPVQAPTPPRMIFPGGVLPPRKTAPPPLPRKPEAVAFVQPALETRGKNPTPADIPDELDFSDVNAAVMAPVSPPPTPPPPFAPTSPTEWSLTEARAALQAAVHDRDQLMNVVLEYAQRTFEYAASFAVVRGSAVGWDARGHGDLSAISNLAIPLDAASVFRTAALTRGSYIGPLPVDALSQHYLALLGRLPRTVFVWPVEVQRRLVALLYGDCGAGPVSQRRLSDFVLFCQDLPAAFHELILFRKRSQNALPHLASPSRIVSAPADAPLGSVQSPDANWLETMMTLLTGPDASERSLALMELMKAPEAAATALAARFPGPTGWSRLPVVELPEPDELGPVPGALARMGQAGALAMAPLLDHSNSDTRYLALLTAGNLKYPEVVDGVLRGLFDDDPDLSSAARAAGAALKGLPQFQAKLPALRQELGSSDGLRRSLAARALGALHDRPSIEGLINLTGSEDDLCAQSAADALKEITHAAFGTNPSAWTAWWARARDLHRLDWLVQALDSADFERRLSAIEELSKTFGNNFGYFADGPQAERTVAIEHWKSAVSARTGGDA